LRRLLRVASSSPRINLATFDWMSQQAKDLREAERERAEGLDSKASSLAGFTGVILSLTATLVSRAPTLTDAELVALIGSLTLLAAAAAVAILGVIVPQAYKTLPVSELRKYLTPPFYSSLRHDVQARTLRATIRQIDHNRKLNSDKAKRLRAASVLLLSGLAGVAALALIIGVHGSGSQTRPVRAVAPKRAASRACAPGSRLAYPSGNGSSGAVVRDRAPAC
jgi:hypothetical protein